MPITAVDRKVLLLKAGVSQMQIAIDCGVDPTIVTHVMAGRFLTSPRGRKVVEHIAQLLDMPVEHLFPEIGK